MSILIFIFIELFFIVDINEKQRGLRVAKPGGGATRNRSRVERRRRATFARGGCWEGEGGPCGLLVGCLRRLVVFKLVCYRRWVAAALWGY